MIKIGAQRLKLTELVVEDAGFLYRLMNTPKWFQFIGDRGVSNEVVAEQYILNSIQPSYIKHGFGSFKVLLKETKQPIGTCGLLQRDFLEYPDLGFAMLPKFERKGYAFEASQAVLNYAKSTLKLNIILAFANPENLASLGLLTKLHFQNYKTIMLDEKQLVLLKREL